MTDRANTRVMGILGRGETWALITALAYTATNLLLRAAAVHIDPWLGSMLRQVPVFAFAWGAVVIGRRAEVWPWSSRFLGWQFAIALIVGGTISFVIGNLFYFNALATGGLGVTASGAQAGIILTALVAGLVALGERPSRQMIAGAAVLVGGLALIGLARGASVDGWLTGLAFALGAGASYAISNVLTRLVQRTRPTTFVALAGTSLGGLVPLLLIQVIRGGGNPIDGADAAQVLIVLAAGCFNAVALLGIVQSMRSTTVAIASSIQSSTVVFSYVAAVILFAESRVPLMVAGVVTVAVGIVISQLGRRPVPAVPDPAVTPPAGPVAS
ncbi:MAG: DMT family transporter [Chloroflexota bacterium]|nr:DMT family transporter [Chloroflexota bacterium]